MTSINGSQLSSLDPAIFGTQGRSDNFNYNKPSAFSLFDVTFFKNNLAIHNQKICEAAAKVFNGENGVAKNMEEVCITFTGSDGRNEKISPENSPIELILVAEKASNLNRVAEKIKSIIQKYPDLFHQTLETKCLETDNVSTFTRTMPSGEKEERGFPTRALDACYMAGSQSVFTKYKIQLYEEMAGRTGKNALPKTLKKFKDSAIKPSLSLLRKIDSEACSCGVNIKTDTLYYDGDRIKATKYPLLRAVQYKLAGHILTQVNQKKISLEDFLTIPSSIIDRIQWLADKKLIVASPEVIETTKKGYALSLYWFAKAQITYARSKETETKLPEGATKEIVHAIKNFCESKTIFPN